MRQMDVWPRLFNNDCYFYDSILSSEDNQLYYDNFPTIQRDFRERKFVKFAIP